MESVPSLAQGVGRMLAQWRASLRPPLSQEGLAQRVANVGLVWTASAIAALEAGTRRLSADEMLLLAAALPIPLGQMLDEGGVTQVRVGGAVVPSLTIQVGLKSGGWISITPPTDDVNVRVARRLQQLTGRPVTAETVAGASARLFGESLAERRDRMVQSAAADAPAARRAAMRGRVTRDLTEQLKVALETKGSRRGPR